MFLELINNYDKLAVLVDRSKMLASVRSFFLERNVDEVDCPMLSRYASIDEHIDLIPAMYQGKEKRYLFSSPEYGMKRLLAMGLKDIYQMSHVFRDGEYGKWHCPEFMMIEWYRLGYSFLDMIQETIECMELFIGKKPSNIITYKQAFQKYCNIDYSSATNDKLLQVLKRKHIEPYDYERDSLLSMILSLVIEPCFDSTKLTVLTNYPTSQAALAKIEKCADGSVARRFEIFYQGEELANGYEELTCAKEQRERLICANQKRSKNNKTLLPLDENFIKALEKGLPQCCGVAVGFDRLMMLRHNIKDISMVVPFEWNYV